jgi:hypothetical protein
VGGNFFQPKKIKIFDFEAEKRTYTPYVEKGSSGYATHLISLVAFFG